MAFRVPGPSLPIDAVFGEIDTALASRTQLILQAPPGAGKSTRLPLALLGADWCRAQRILLLEPRRLAARSIARRMSSLLGEEVGGTVGYRMRGETRVGPHTRIEVVTEGVLTRMLVADPTLESVGALLFDEFHERSLHADLGLALALQTQELVRADLRIVVMSATLDGIRLSELLPDAAVVATTSRAFPVELRYQPPRAETRIEAAVAQAVRTALTRDSGSVLAFLPGVGEITRCRDALAASGLPHDVDVRPLFGDMSPRDQDAAVAPSPPGRRKVVLATSIAETSLTIEDVQVVVDGGLSRVPRFSPRSGMSRLETVRVSRTAADQRAGRAGRTAPGVCYRLWAEHEQISLAERSRPEILEADLAPLVLDLAAAGVRDTGELRWIDQPPLGSIQQARELLRTLGAVDGDDRITEHGRDTLRLGVHPRIGHMLLSATGRGFGVTSCYVAALLEERDILRRGDGERDPDFHRRLELFSQHPREVPRSVQVRASDLRASLGIPRAAALDDTCAGMCLALAYPDRVAQQRGLSGRFLLRNGSGAVLRAPGSLSREEFLAIADLDGRSPDATIFLAAPISREEVLDLFAGELVEEELLEWDAATERIRASTRLRLGSIVLSEARVDAPSPDAVSDLLVSMLAEGRISLEWPAAAQALRQRVAFVRSLHPSWPDLSDDALSQSMRRWLAPHLGSVRRRQDLERLPLFDLLLDFLSWEQRRDLERMAPTHVVVPTGSRIPVDYSDVSSPRIAVRLQELFGLEASPMLADGRIRLTIELLSPAHRPVQVTTDLAGFWRNSYFDVRKDLRGRYPRHAWPEDPLTASPTRRAKPRGS